MSLYYSEHLECLNLESKQKVKKNAEAYVSGSISLITFVGELLNFAFYFVLASVVSDVRNTFRNVNCELLLFYLAVVIILLPIFMMFQEVI